MAREGSLGSRETTLRLGHSDGVMITILKMVPHLPAAGRGIGSGVD